jgi:hypothetical protein
VAVAAIAGDGATTVVLVVVVVGASVVVVGAVDVVDEAGAPDGLDDEHAAANNKTAAVALTPTCVWRISPELVVALDEQFGEPVDAYVNGSQVWLRDDGPGGIVTLEWRLHPVAGFQRPPSTNTYELFAAVALALESGGTPPAPPAALWDGLEVFAAYDDEIEPAVLRAAATESLGLAPDAAGLVDHQRVGDEWERTGGKVSVIDALLAQLSPSSGTP